MPGAARGGNEVWQRTPMKHSVQGLCGRDCTPTRWQAYHSAPSHGPVRLGSNPRSSVCCSSDASGALGPCPCGRPLDPSGHQCAACPHTGVLGRRGFPLESAAAHVSREAGGESDYERPSPGSGPASKSRSRQSPFGSGGRWTPLFHGAQLAIDTTMVSPVRMDGSARRQCATTNSAPMAQARVRKERTRTCSGSRSGTPGGGGLRSRRPVVGRGPFLPQLVGKR